MMRLLSSVPLVAIVLIALTGVCSGQNETTTTLPPSTPLTNPDFETGTAGEAPPGWDVRAGATGKVTLDRTTAFAGEQCTTITATAGAGRLFTNLMQGIDAKPYQGKRVRFRAAVQVKDLPADTKVQLWMRVDQPKGPDGKSEASSFDNMDDRPIRNAMWAHHDVVLDVAPDAARILCGIFVIGPGKAWIDDASLSLVGDNVPTTPQPKAAVEPPPTPQPAPKAITNQAADGLQNGDFEADTVGTAPSGWRFSSRSGGTAVVDDDGPSAGEQAVLIDASDLKGSERKFTNLSQSFSAKPWQGKRVTFRAAVRVGDLTAGSTVQLWMRVDQPKDANGAATSSAFDNMGNRPIKNELWGHHEIVLDVAKDADRIVLGIFVIGEGKAWLDDVTFAVAAEDKKTTNAKPGGGSRSSRQMDPRVLKALQEAGDAPQQPFWTWWLLLPALAIGLFCFAMWPLRRMTAADKDAPLVAAKPSIARWFALDFTIIYWLLYCLPRPLGDVLGRLGGALRATEEPNVLAPVAKGLSTASVWMREQMQGTKTWLTEQSSELVFGIPSETLVPPNGSGDGTFGYIANFSMFVVAVLIAGGLCFVRRRPVRYEALVDLMRTFLRFVLVFYLLSYGLAKTAIPPNQFAMLGDAQLNRTWGDTAPMGVVWSFIGASESYRIFGGICEVLPALLLVSRRTATLGALVSLTVMTNVAMLNYCYDVPVKLLSSHLVIISVMICTPDILRLAQFFAGNRNTLTPGLPSVWTGTWQRWTRRIIKAIVIVVAVAMPIYNNIANTREHLAEQNENGPPPKSKHKLMKRGFRWINEVPYSR